MQKILQTVNKFAIDTTKVFVLALKVICRDIILPMLISFQNCSMPAAAGLQQRSPTAQNIGIVVLVANLGTRQ